MNSFRHWWWYLCRVRSVRSTRSCLAMPSSGRASSVGHRHGDSTGRSPRPAQPHRRSPVLRQSCSGGLVYSRFCLGISTTAAEMSNGPGQITPPNHISSGIIYISIYNISVAAGSSNKISSRIEAHDVVPSIRYECLTNVCTTAAAHFLSCCWYAICATWEVKEKDTDKMPWLRSRVFKPKCYPISRNSIKYTSSSQN